MSQPKQGNFFMLPNEIFNMDLTAEEIALYAFLMRMEDRKTFTCYPAFKTIGEALKMGSKNTVMKYVRLLEEKELIETEHTVVEHHDGSLRNGNLNPSRLPIPPRAHIYISTAFCCENQSIQLLHRGIVT